MSTMEKGHKANADHAKQRNTGDQSTGRADAVQRMNEKKKGAGWKPPPQRGDVKKGIVKDIVGKLAGCTARNLFTVPVHDESVLLADE